MTPHVRTAGRLGLFLLLAAASYVVAGPVVAMAGLDGFTAIAAYGAITALGLIAATAICIRVGRSTWHAAGVEFSRRRWLELAAGFLGGALLFAVVLLAQGVMAGERWQTNARVSPAGIVLGLAVVLALLLSEELLFRGYAFQQVAGALGPRVALAASAVAFGVYHVIGSGNWAMGALFGFAMPLLGGLVFGYALLRSGSLALPIGLHWGGNWAQAQVLGLGHAAEHSTAIWTMPLTPAQTERLAAPDLAPHLPYLVALALTAFVLRTLRFTAPRPG